MNLDSGFGAVRRKRSNACGRLVVVRIDGSTQNAIETDPDEEVSEWCVQAQPLTPVPSQSMLLVSYWIGDAAFVLPLIPIVAGLGPMVRAVVQATKVRAEVVAAPGSGGLSFNLSVGVTRGGKLLGPERSGGRWVQAPSAAASLADFYLVYAATTFGTAPPVNQGAAASLYGGTVTVTTFPAGVSVLYALLFDATARPAANAVPLPGGRSTQLGPGNPSAQFGGEFLPIQGWASGLVVALSTTADVYTQPAAGGQFTFDGFIGQ